MNPARPIKIAHLIVDLDIGGAEMMLLKLAERLNHARYQSVIYSMVDGGALRPRFETLGVPVISLGMRYGRPTVRGVYRLIRDLRREAPLILHTWMYHANLIGLPAARLGGIPALIWNIRASMPDLHHYPLSTQWVVRAGAMLSAAPDIVVVNAESGAADHARLGYHPRVLEIIPNGFDMSRFQPDSLARQSVRRELGLDDIQPVVGLIARYNPIKDHPNFLEAARILAAQLPDVRFVLAGRDITPENAALSSLIAAGGLQDRVMLLGARDDAPRLMQALDVLALSSAFGEGFPNVIGEAMACAVPVVATDIGDSRMIIADTGVVVPLRDPRALADGLERVLRLSPAERHEWGLRGRARIAAEFSIERIVGRYEAMFQSVADRVMAQPSGRAPGQP